MSSRQPDWFKFEAMQWLAGSIRMFSLEHQGLYINLVSIIWSEGGLFKEGMERLAQKAAPIECVRDGKLEHILTLMRDLIDAGLLEQDTAGGMTVKFLSEQLRDIDKFRARQRRNVSQRYTGAIAVESVKASSAAEARDDRAAEAFTAAKERTMAELKKNRAMLSRDDLRILTKVLRQAYGRIRLSGHSRDAVNMGIEAAICEWSSMNAQ